MWTGDAKREPGRSLAGLRGIGHDGPIWTLMAPTCEIAALDQRGVAYSERNSQEKTEKSEFGLDRSGNYSRPVLDLLHGRREDHVRQAVSESRQAQILGLLFGIMELHRSAVKMSQRRLAKKA